MTEHSDQVHALGKRIANHLRDLLQAERPTQDVWWEALGLAVADSVVRNVTAYDQPEVTSSLLAYIENAVPVLQDTIPPEIEAQRRPTLWPALTEHIQQLQGRVATTPATARKRPAFLA
jgi:hypothetical protein